MGPFDENWLIASVLLSTPLIYAGMGELVAERSGVINIGLEGMMLSGALTAYLVAWNTGSLLFGAAAGVAGGAAIGVLMAVLSIEARANQIVVGVGLNILAIGTTSFIFGEVFPGGQGESIGRTGDIAIPLLADIPVVGRPFFDQSLFVYGAFVAALVMTLALRWSPFGLSVRAAGEVPAAVDTAGVSVRSTRWLAVLTASSMAGLGGAALAIGQIGLFADQMTAGRGFLAFAAVIFGRWRPAGVLLGCAIFGAGDALQLRLQAESTIPREFWAAAALVSVLSVASVVRFQRPGQRRVVPVIVGGVLAALFMLLLLVDPAWTLPAQLWVALPFVLTIVVLAGFGKRAQAPSALAVAYDRSSV